MGYEFLDAVYCFDGKDVQTVQARYSLQAKFDSGKWSRQERGLGLIEPA